MGTARHPVAFLRFVAGSSLTPPRVGLLRAGVVAALIVAAAVAGTPAAFADRAADGEGADGSYSVSITVGSSGEYEVSIAALNRHPDVTASSVQMEVVDDGGTRTFLNPYQGGQVRDVLAFDNRGPCTVRITFRFTRVDGQEQTNTTRPVTISYPSAASEPGPEPASAPPRSGAPSTAGDGGAADCVTPAGMNALLDQDTSDSQRPWKRPAGTRATINFVVDESITPEWRSDLDHGAAAWSRSPCLDARVVDTCPSGGNCVSVSALDAMDADGNFDAVEKDGFTTGGRITLLNKLNTNQRRNVAVHEMGHAVGLVHRRTKHTMMNEDTFDDIFDPDPTDYKNLLFSYDRMQREP